MKEYIDREATLNERPEGRNPGQVGKEEYNKGWNDCRSAFYKCITSMPAADVVEVRHGRWIPSDMGGGEPDEAYICSECEEPWTLIAGTPEENNMRYCPACGARMDKEASHEVS